MLKDFTLLISFIVVTINLHAQYPLFTPQKSSDETTNQYKIVVNFIDGAKNSSFKKLKSNSQITNQINETEGLKATYKTINKLKIDKRNLKYYGSLEIKKGKHFYYTFFLQYTEDRIKLINILEFQFAPKGSFLEKTKPVPYEKKLFTENEQYINDNPPPPPPPEPMIKY